MHINIKGVKAVGVFLPEFWSNYLLNYILFQVIEEIVDHVTNSQTSDWPEEISVLVDRLQHYQELLTDYTQAQVLQDLGRGNMCHIFVQSTTYSPNCMTL